MPKARVLEACLWSSNSGIFWSPTKGTNMWLWPWRMWKSTHINDTPTRKSSRQRASYQIRKIAGCACAWNAGNVLPRRRIQRKPRVGNPGVHHGTCVTHVPWCMPGLLTRGRWRGKRPRHSRRICTRNLTYLIRGPFTRGTDGCNQSSTNVIQVKIYPAKPQNPDINEPNTHPTPSNCY